MTRLVLGLGHPDRADDGVGAAVVEYLSARCPPDVQPSTVDDPLSLIDLWSAAERVVVVDAVVSGASPGTVHTMDVTHTPLPVPQGTAGGSHTLGLAAAIELARTIDRLPPRLVVVGVEVETTGSGAALSARVAAAVPAAAEAVLVSLTDR
jgi:hydrogenase maturation protease